jgi:OmcA/MtrC family decaheme c-type cytochrome
VLKDCEACHLPGTYDFSATASAASLPNRLFRTTVSGTLASTGSTYSYAPYITQDLNYGAGFSFNAGTGATTQAAGTTLVTSPISTACFACHDSTLAKAHMEINGGTLYGPRSVGLGTTETCMVCHEVGRIGDIKAVHKR